MVGRGGESGNFGENFDLGLLRSSLWLSPVLRCLEGSYLKTNEVACLRPRSQRRVLPCVVLFQIKSTCLKFASYCHSTMYPQFTHGMFVLWQPNALGTGSGDLTEQESWAVSQMINTWLRPEEWSITEWNIWALCVRDSQLWGKLRIHESPSSCSNGVKQGIRDERRCKGFWPPKSSSCSYTIHPRGMVERVPKAPHLSSRLSGTQSLTHSLVT